MLSRCTLMMGGVAPSDPPLFIGNYWKFWLVSRAEKFG
jgi:hypothetical protein